MSDITFVKGYGFPRGSAMDFAGYGSAPTAGDLNYGPVRFEGVTQSPVRFTRLPEPGVFAPIPALDGLFCEEGYGPVHFGNPRAARRTSQTRSCPPGYSMQVPSYSPAPGAPQVAVPGAPARCTPNGASAAQWNQPYGDVTIGPISLSPTPGFVGPAGVGADGLVHYADGSTCDPSAGACPGGPFTAPNNAAAGLWALGALAVGIALFMKR